MLEQFIDNLKVVSIQVIILYLIAGVGFIADKTKIFRQNDAKRLVDLLFNIILPIAVVNSFMSIERTPQRIKGLFISFALAILTHIVGIIIASFSFKNKNVKLRGIYSYAITFSNAAFLALPLAQSVIGDEGMFYGSCYVAVFNMFAFTYGIYQISGKKAKINAKMLIFNPGTMSVLIGVPLFLLQVKFPSFIIDAMSRIGACNSPMAMVVFGTFLANCNFKNIFAKKEIYYVSFIKLLVIPLVMIALFKVFGVNGNMAVALTIAASAPVATNTAMYAAKYNNDTALSSELVGQTSILSIITMPVIVAIASLI